jgi:Reverse transcriptase (RNA-dependent DNA polymerase)
MLRKFTSIYHLYTSNFMSFPQIFITHKMSCKLHHPLYGTKQGAHTWYLKVVQVFTLLGYMVSLSDKAVLYKFGHDKFTIVAVATDNFTIMSKSDGFTELLKQQVCKHWEITDLGSINWLLSMKITHNLKAQTISLCQQSYIEQILVCFELDLQLHHWNLELISPQILLQYCQPC